MASFDQAPSRTASPSTARPTLETGHTPHSRPLSAYSSHAKVGLDSLRDSPPGQKPLYQYSTLIYHAIKGSPSQRLPLEEIYAAIEARYSYFSTAPPGWKNSVLHHLSLNPVFEKVMWPEGREKREYWTVNEEATNRPVAVVRSREEDGEGGTSSRSSSRLDNHRSH